MTSKKTNQNKMIDEVYTLNYNLGLTAARANQLTVAAQYLARALMFCPDRTDGWRLLGLCLFTLGRLASARTCWENSMRLSPEDDRVAAWLAECRQQEHRQTEAISQLRRLGKQKQYRKAACLAEQLLETSTTTVALLVLAGQMQHLAGRRRKARQTWLHARELDQSDPQIIRCLLMDESQMGSTDRRISDYLRRLINRLIKRKEQSHN